MRVRRLPLGPFLPARPNFRSAVLAALALPACNACASRLPTCLLHQSPGLLIPPRRRRRRRRRRRACNMPCSRLPLLRELDEQTLYLLASKMTPFRQAARAVPAVLRYACCAVLLWCAAVLCLLWSWQTAGWCDLQPE